jgi:hypothetical protein
VLPHDHLPGGLQIEVRPARPHPPLPTANVIEAFKWIKQNLRLKSFYGYSDNAVRTQVWIAVCTYVLAAMVRKELKLEASLSRMLQILSVSVFEKVPLAHLFAENQWDAGLQNDTPSHSNHLILTLL